jgi:hypothetical protein
MVEPIVDKLDFKKLLPEFYAPKNQQWHEVEVPTLQYLMIDGEGDPNTAEQYALAVQALFSVAYTIKFASKKELSKDFVVMPLEGLWYADDMSVFERFEKSQYQWTMMIMQPDWIMPQMFAQAQELAHRKNPGLPHDKLRLQTYQEGKCLQLLHLGSYDSEAPKLHALHHEIMPAQNLSFNGHHHEIYLSDPRRVASEKLKTILRQPVRPQ